MSNKKAKICDACRNSFVEWPTEGDVRRWKGSMRPSADGHHAQLVESSEFDISPQIFHCPQCGVHYSYQEWQDLETEDV